MGSLAKKSARFHKLCVRKAWNDGPLPTDRELLVSKQRFPLIRHDRK